MSWAAILEVLFKLLTPVIAELIRQFFDRAVPKLGEPPLNTRKALAAAFAAAWAETSPWRVRDWPARAVLARAERVALRRADDIANAVAGTGLGSLELTKADAAELGGALK